MRLTNIILPLIGITCLLGCDYKKNTDNTWSKTTLSTVALQEIVDKYGKSLDYDSLLLIPGVGCSPCISDAQSFFYSSKDNAEMLFIFTDITDLKMFKQEIDPDLWKKKNVLVDSLNSIVDSGLETIYPSLLKVTNNHIYMKIFQKKTR